MAMAFGLAGGCSQPPQNYANSCSMPLAHWGREKGGLGHMAIPQPIYVGSDGSILWNRTLIDERQLRDYMHQMSELNPIPQAILEVAPTAPCSRVIAVRNAMDSAAMCKGPYSHCSEGWQWRQWQEKGP